MPDPLKPDRPCRKCRCPVKFLPSVDSGEVIPLDLRSPVFLIFRSADGSEFCWPAKQFVAASAEPVVTPTGQEATLVGVGVSHFFSCPFASEFGRGKAAPAPVTGT